MKSEQSLLLSALLSALLAGGCQALCNCEFDKSEFCRRVRLCLQDNDDAMQKTTSTFSANTNWLYPKTYNDASGSGEQKCQAYEVCCNSGNTDEGSKIGLDLSETKDDDFCKNVEVCFHAKKQDLKFGPIGQFKEAPTDDFTEATSQKSVCPDSVGNSCFPAKEKDVKVLQNGKCQEAPTGDCTETTSQYSGYPGSVVNSSSGCGSETFIQGNPVQVYQQNIFSLILPEISVQTTKSAYEWLIPQWGKIINYASDFPAKLAEVGTGGQYLLHLIAASKNPDTSNLEKVLDLPNIDIDAVDQFGQTALHVAVSVDDLQAVQLLLRYNASSIPNKSGTTPLHLAIYSKNVEIVRAIVEAGTTGDAPNDLMAMHLAIATNSVEIIDILLKSGSCQPGMQQQHSEYDTFEIGFFNVETCGENLAPQAMISGVGMKVGPLVHHAVAECNIGVIQRLIQCGAKLDETDPNGDTALSFAVQVCPSAVESFLKNKTSLACLDIENKEGRTVLQIATEIGDLETAEKLRTAGAASTVNKDVEEDAKCDNQDNKYEADPFQRYSHPEASSGSESANEIETSWSLRHSPGFFFDLWLVFILCLFGCSVV